MLKLACLHPSYPGAKGHSNTGNTIDRLVNDVPVNPETQPCDYIYKRHYSRIGDLCYKAFPGAYRLSCKPHEYQRSLPVEPVCVSAYRRFRVKLFEK